MGGICMSKKKTTAREIYLDCIKELSRDIKTNDYVSGTAQFTDMTNTDYFLKVYGKEIKYCKPWKKFLVWNKNKWETDENGEVDSLVDTLIRNMYKGAIEIKDVKLRLDFESHIKKSESVRRRKALIESLAMNKTIKVKPEELDIDKWIFTCINGMINLKDGTFHEHDRSKMITMSSKFIYKKDALCPTWERFLLQIMDQDLELIHFVQKAMGYALTSDMSEQVMFILWGAGANGKSTFLNVLTDLMGDYAGTTQAETFMKTNNTMNNDIARLRGKRLVTTSETEQGKRLSETLIKQITGEDVLTARFLYGEYFDFFPTFKIFMATNHKPAIRGNDLGIWRRIRLIPFNVTIKPEDMDKNLKTKIEHENSGIFNWLIRGCLLWQKEGLQTPKIVEAATKEYQEDADVVGQFLKECCTVTASEIFRVSNKCLYEAYIEWCEKNSEKACSKKFLAYRMQEKGFKKMVGNKERFWLGVALNIV
jgi:putative DNA primase/helicase